MAETAHGWLVDLIPNAPALVLDVGARSAAEPELRSAVDRLDAVAEETRVAIAELLHGNDRNFEARKIAAAAR